MRPFFEGIPRGVDGEPTRVIVVGAGASGLTVAKILADHGVDNVVLEARDRPGGRIDTIRVGNAVVDQGAAWVDGVPKNPLHGLVLSAGSETVDMRYLTMSKLRMFDGNTGQWLPRSRLLLGTLLAAFYDRRRRKADEPSYGAWVNSTVGENPGALKEAARFVLRTYAELSDGADADEIGLDESDLVDEYGGIEHMPVGGYRNLVDKLAEGVDIRFEVKVESVTLDPKGVAVGTSHGEFRGSHAVITIPHAVLKAGTITFVPELPEEKLGAIRRIGVGNFEKVILSFDEAFWRKAGRDRHDFSYASPIEGELPIFVDASRPAGAPVLVAIAAGTQARQIASDPITAYETAMRVLGQAFGDVPKPRARHTTSWANDPFAMSSYSFHGVETRSGDPEVLAKPVGGRLLFAGEATQSAHTGYVGGAIESGVREARRLLGEEADLVIQGPPHTT